jgi:hypothetical protein
MQRPLAITIAAVCFGLASCQVFEKSEIWDAVTHVTPGDSIRDPDPSAAYAVKLHRVLLEQGVEHFVVTYQFHYFTHERDEAVDTRTAVVYRDPVSSAYPWWLKDERTATPVWLPNGDLSSQISFYIRRPAQVIEQKHYPAGGKGGKATLGMFQPAQVKQRPVFAEHPQHAVTRITQTHITPAPAKKPVLTFQPVAAKPAAARAAVSVTTKIHHLPKVAEVKPKVFTPVVPSPETARPALAWASPGSLYSATQSSDSSLRGEHLGKLFRARNGTSYDPTSSMDRRKMELLKHGLTGKETFGESELGRAVDGFEDTPR